MEKEKRRFKRIPKGLKVGYTVLSKVDSTPVEFGNCVAVDISRSGLSMTLDKRVSVPVLFQLQIRVAGQPQGLFVLGKSVYCTPIEEVGRYRIGIQFVGILPSGLEQILEALDTPVD